MREREHRSGYGPATYVEVHHIEGDRARLSVSLHDPVTQQVTTSHVVLGTSGARFYPVNVRYAWPAELDLMARLAGLEPHERWGGWRGEPFTADSSRHVSVYRRPAPQAAER